MKFIFTLLTLMFFNIFCFAQTFTGSGGNIPSIATTQTCFDATVSGVGIINSNNGLVSVCMNITHTDVGDLEIVLRSPDGTIVPLTIQSGGNGNNFATTCFTSTASTAIKFGTAPFNGSFLPEGHLGAVNNGQNANGVWSLCILDRRNSSGTGTVNSWSISFGNNPAALPPALPSCANVLPSSSSCATATLVCDFNGQCGSTAAPSVQDWPGSNLNSCFSLQNNSFIKFIAAATSASFSVWIPTTSRTNYLDGGVQMLFFSGTCDVGPVTSYGCYPHIYPYSGNGQPLISVITASGLTAGNTYYLMIDGYNGDNCTFTIAANTGVNILNINPPAPEICVGQSVNLTASGGNGIFSWNPPANLSATTGTTVTANPTNTTTYTVTSTTPAGCPITKDVTVTVNPLPAAPIVTATEQPTCAVPTGTITITAPLGTGLQYSIGGTYQSSPIFTGVTPNTYNVTVQNAQGCISNGTAVTINAAPPTQASPLNITTVHPTCAEPTGSIILTPPAGSNLEYSINGITYQASTTFLNVAPGNYSITVRNTVTGCVSGITPITVNAAPTLPSTPTGSVTIQPNCSISTGQITITSPLGANYEYSINGGGTYQSAAVFNNLNAGAYLVVVRNTVSGCLSPVLSLTVNAAPSAPNAPTIETSLPTCQQFDATIRVLSPLGPQYMYSLNGGTYTASPNFSVLVNGTYIVTVRDIVSGCTSPGTGTTITIGPTTPEKPTVQIVQPACPILTGDITVNSPIAANVEYSLNGINYQVSNLFTNIAAGTYNITARFIGTTCVSSQTEATIVALAPGQCLPPTITDIYFPSAFTPNGDGVNDGFGPIPKNLLSLISQYSLQVFNRYGERVFNSNIPTQQWNGRYKGKMLGNNSYTWVAQYSLNGRPPVIKKGSVTLIK